jgi:plasmid stability protein
MMQQTTNTAMSRFRVRNVDEQTLALIKDQAAINGISVGEQVARLLAKALEPELARIKSTKESGSS